MHSSSAYGPGTAILLLVRSESIYLGLAAGVAPSGSFSGHFFLWTRREMSTNGPQRPVFLRLITTLGSPDHVSKAWESFGKYAKRSFRV